MIRSISASNPSFLPITFQPGFNVILADRDPTATDQQSRNARGKTSLLYVINFLLGGSLSPSLTPLAADGWAFTLTLDLFDQEVSVTRVLGTTARLAISYPESLSGILGPYTQEGSISLSDWKDVLGLSLFRLEPADEDAMEALSVRTLLNYVVRSAATADPLRTFSTQPALSVRKHVAFLLGLDWNVVRDLQIVNNKLDDLHAVVRAIQGGVVESLRTTEELQLERSAAQNAVDALRDRVGQFRVLEDPDDIVRRADQLTSSISAIRDQAFVDQRMETLYMTAIEEGGDADRRDETRVAEIYGAAGAVFGAQTSRRLEQVEAFRRNLLMNRRQFLDAELTEVRQRLANLTGELRVLDSQREILMEALRAGGALDELLALQEEFAALTNRVVVLDAQIEQSRDVAVTIDQLKSDKAQLRSNASTKLAEDREKIDEISDRFREKMNRLYDVDAAITVSVDNGGYVFSTQVASGTSNAVGKMKLFCFDLTLLEEGIATGHHPDFLIHDSSVFDGVDPRQRASALQFANTTATALGGQYICTINSNDVPDDVARESWFANGVVRTVLDTDTGGIFGVSF